MTKNHIDLDNLFLLWLCYSTFSSFWLNESWHFFSNSLNFIQSQKFNKTTHINVYTRLEWKKSSTQTTITIIIYYSNFLFFFCISSELKQATWKISSPILAMGVECEQTYETIDECLLGKTMDPKDRRPTQRTQYRAIRREMNNLICLNSFICFVSFFFQIFSFIFSLVSINTLLWNCHTFFMSMEQKNCLLSYFNN